MKILIVHNFYKTSGGEDVVFENEVKLLRDHNIEVEIFTAHNEEIEGFFKKVCVAVGSIFSIPTFFRIREVLKKFRPDLIHVHNFFPLISPSLFFAAKLYRIPTVLTIHNFRLGCPVGTAFRDGKICTKCFSRKLKWPALVHRCYQNSFPGSFWVALLFSIHSSIGTWRYLIDRYIALTEFQKRFLESIHVLSEKIVIKQNFIPATTLFDSQEIERQKKLLYVGRLSDEKGIRQLISAFRATKIDLQLDIIGEDRIFGAAVSELLADQKQIRFLGRQDRNFIDRCMKESLALIVPSIYFEGMPMVVLNALSLGLPVLASNSGALCEVIKEGETGYLFNPNAEDEIVNAINKILSDFDEQKHYKRISKNCIALAHEKYSEKLNFELLHKIYQDVVYPYQNLY